MHPEILARTTGACFRKLNRCEWLKDFYLAGGTAVAVWLGHRESIDLDFFSAQKINTLRLRQKLSSCGAFLLDEESAGTLHGTLDGVKVSFLEYPYPLLQPLADYDGVNIADLQDLACMKLEAIASRGKKRDFIDVYALSQRGNSLRAMVAWFEQKYSGLQYNLAHLIKSLVFFQDAEHDPMPVMLQPADWAQVKGFFQREARTLLPS